MYNPCECSNTYRGEDDWQEGTCGQDPGKLLAEIEWLRLELTRVEKIAARNVRCDDMVDEIERLRSLVRNLDMSTDSDQNESVEDEWGEDIDNTDTETRDGGSGRNLERRGW